MSLTTFVAIGVLVQFDIKGSKECLLRLMPEGLVRDGPNLFNLIWLSTWALVAALVGWALQSAIVMALSFKDEKRKSTP